MHHDARWWEDAEAFKPERWVGDKTGGDKSGGLAYMPFGAGPRMCIGYKLAGSAHCLMNACMCILCQLEMVTQVPSSLCVIGCILIVWESTCMLQGLVLGCCKLLDI